jgi:hypothetical protein
MLVQPRDLVPQHLPRPAPPRVDDVLETIKSANRKSDDGDTVWLRLQKLF